MAHVNPIIPELTQHLRNVLQTLPEGKRYFVAVGGVPGKTSLTKDLHAAVNAAVGQEVCAILPMDGRFVLLITDESGFHFYRKLLDEMPDPAEAHKRRGAPFTFDAARFLTTIQRLKVDGHCSLPSFDHALKDPCEDDIEILPNHKIILAEGIYLLLSPTDQPPESPGYDFSAWYQVREEWDERWFMDVDIDTAMNRLAVRHTQTLGLNMEEAIARFCSCPIAA